MQLNVVLFMLISVVVVGFIIVIGLILKMDYDYKKDSVPLRESLNRTEVLAVNLSTQLDKLNGPKIYLGSKRSSKNRVVSHTERELARRETQKTPR